MIMSFIIHIQPLPPIAGISHHAGALPNRPEQEAAPLPAPFAWFHRLPEILDVHRGIDATHLDRQAVEQLFRSTVCGEQSVRVIENPCRCGSSPRVRGTGRARPAASARPGVHPRVCGEQAWSSRRSFSVAGSSPRVRGTDDGFSHRTSFHRFIPACAGNRSRRFPSPASPSVHPRVCGEQVTTVSVASVPIGSSPRVRGTEIAA